jgi:hypothetical protein
LEFLKRDIPSRESFGTRRIFIPAAALPEVFNCDVYARAKPCGHCMADMRVTALCEPS